MTPSDKAAELHELDRIELDPEDLAVSLATALGLLDDYEARECILKALNTAYMAGEIDRNDGEIR